MYDAWEATAIKNPTIDFYIFTDIEEISDNHNIYVIKMSFEECRNIIQKIIEFDICLKEPYKLCDYRPTYGLAFKKWLGKYDFWGYCDFDLLLGNLRKFFTDEVLQNAERCLENGHISLWKNNEKLNTVFKYHEKNGMNYELVYKKPEAFYFDEQAGVYTKCLINGVKFCDAVPLRDPLEHCEKFFYLKEKDDYQYIIYWEAGTLYACAPNKKEELCYAHFFRRDFEAVNKQKIESI